MARAACMVQVSHQEFARLLLSLHPSNYPSPETSAALIASYECSACCNLAPTTTPTRRAALFSHQLIRDDPVDRHVVSVIGCHKDLGNAVLAGQ